MTFQYISYNCGAEAKGACVSHGYQGPDGQSSNVTELGSKSVAGARVHS